METSKIKGIEQGRAKFAYECASIGSKKKKNKEYKSYVKKIPMLIKTNGLGSTFAFIYSKSDNDESKPGYAYKLIYDQTTEWLKKDEKQLIDLSKPNTNLVEEIVKLDSTPYRALTNEVIAFFIWLRRFSEGLIEEEETNES